MAVSKPEKFTEPALQMTKTKVPKLTSPAHMEPRLRSWPTLSLI